ncbi:MAG: beta-Ala-His dipeptidase [Chloroflexota bacterium]
MDSHPTTTPPKGPSLGGRRGARQPWRVIVVVTGVVLAACSGGLAPGAAPASSPAVPTSGAAASGSPSSPMARVPLVDGIAGLAPRAVWQHFSDLNAIPRMSHQEARVSAFVAAFGRSLGDQTTVNDVGNVIIHVAATSGMEDRPGVVLQAHLDMVGEKTADTVFNFDTEPIRAVLDDGWVHASGTTLGADDGVGVALIMALIEAKDVPHGPIEALFTVDEEDAFTGVSALRAGDLQFRTCINVDNEIEGNLLVSSAGGVNVDAHTTYDEVATPAGLTGFTVAVDGLLGGHSGVAIDKGRGSANQLIARFIAGVPAGLGVRVAAVRGGTVYNAIPSKATAIIALPGAQAGALAAYAGEFAAAAVAKLGSADPGLTVTVAPADVPARVMTPAAQAAILGAIAAAPQGVQAMSPDVPGLVETSSNLGLLAIADGTVTLGDLVRSAKDAERDVEARRVADALAVVGARVATESAYAGWTANPDSRVLALMQDSYKRVFGTDATVAALHVGLETSLVGVTFPGMDMISVGPTIVGAHSPDERLDVASVARAYDLLAATLGSVK